MISAGRRGIGGQSRARYLRYVDIDYAAIERIARGWIPSEIRKRTIAGTGADGSALLSDLNNTGRMLASFQARRRRRRKGHMVIDFAPDKRQRGGITNARLGRILDKGVRNRSHDPGSAKARKWDEGADGWRIRPRPWLGLTAQQRAALVVEMKKGRTIVQKQGRP